MVGFAVRGLERYKLDRSKLYCTHCNRKGYDNAGCFILHGFPDWYIENFEKSNSKNNYKGKSQIAHSSQVTHTNSVPVVCANNAVVNNSSVELSSAHSISHTPRPGGSPLPGFTTDQWTSLLTLFGNFNVTSRLHGKTYLSWLIDTGRDGHGTGYPEPNRSRTAWNRNSSRQVLNRPDPRNRETAGTVKPPKKNA